MRYLLMSMRLVVVLSSAVMFSKPTSFGELATLKDHQLKAAICALAHQLEELEQFEKDRIVPSHSYHRNITHVGAQKAELRSLLEFGVRLLKEKSKLPKDLELLLNKSLLSQLIAKNLSS